MSAIQTYMYILYLLYSYIIVYADVGQEKKSRLQTLQCNIHIYFGKGISLN